MHMNIKTLGFALLLACSGAVGAKAAIGESAPDFSLTGIDGAEHSLAQYRGKTVVLEWTNRECPFVKKHYDSGNMQKLQNDAIASGAVWLIINSGAQGKQGQVDAAGAQKILDADKATPSAYLLDGSGTVGMAYGAKTTPHMYVIDPEGTLVYMGAIDSNPSANPKDIPGATNYVSAALASLQAGEPVAQAVTVPYGCSVKY